MCSLSVFCAQNSLPHRAHSVPHGSSPEGPTKAKYSNCPVFWCNLTFVYRQLRPCLISDKCSARHNGSIAIMSAALTFAPPELLNLTPAPDPGPAPGSLRLVFSDVFNCGTFCCSKILCLTRHSFVPSSDQLPCSRILDCD